MNDLLAQGIQLPIMEDFYTIQGEGFHSGTASYFIRIGGCDVGCHWCDVKESWNAEKHPATDVKKLVEQVLTYSKTIVLTGGEPLMWNLNFLTDLLKQNNCTVHIETSGAYPLSGKLDWICLSPKKNMLPTEEIYPLANELKVIIYNQHDFIFAEQQAGKVSQNCQLFLKSEWSKREEMNPKIVEYVMKNPKWKISIQTHKYLNIP